MKTILIDAFDIRFLVDASDDIHEEARTILQSVLALSHEEHRDARRDVRMRTKDLKALSADLSYLEKSVKNVRRQIKEILAS